MVLRLNLDTQIFQLQDHFGAQVLMRVVRSHWEVAAFRTHEMTQAARSVMILGAAAVPMRLIRINLDTLPVISGGVMHIVEDVELRFRPEEASVAMPLVRR